MKIIKKQGAHLLNLQLIKIQIIIQKSETQTSTQMEKYCKQLLKHGADNP